MACQAVPGEPNSYASGQCTIYCKQKAPWVPNGWGNAGEWFTNAQQCGFKTSQQPQKDAIAIWGPGVDPPWGFGHCALVTSVNSDGSFWVTEQNWKGVGVVDSRKVSDRANFVGFILPPGAQTTGDGGDTSGLGGAIQQAGSQLVSAGQVAGGGLLVLGGLIIAVLLVARPGPLRALR